MTNKYDNHFSQLISMYKAARINAELFVQSKMTIEHGRCRISLPVHDNYFHAMKAVHGAVYFKLLDDAAFFAVQSEVTDRFVVTTSFNIHLIRPANAGVLHAEGEVKFRSKNLFVAESRLFNNNGKEIGFGTGSFTPGRALLSEAEGYGLG